MPKVPNKKGGCGKAKPEQHMNNRGRSLYRVIRNWVDRDLGSVSTNNLALVPFLIIILIACSAISLMPSQSRLIVGIGVVLAVAWAIFFLWRSIRMLKAASISSDRQYDRVGKYSLPPEYANSESVSATGAERKRETDP